VSEQAKTSDGQEEDKVAMTESGSDVKKRVMKALYHAEDFIPWRGSVRHQAEWSELDADGYNLRGDAQRGHLAMCEKWAEADDVGPPAPNRVKDRRRT